MKFAIVIVLLLVTGCGLTRTTVTMQDGSECKSITYTIGKDVSGGKFSGCGAAWGVESSDPNAAMAQGMMQMMNFMVPLAIKGMMVP